MAKKKASGGKIGTKEAEAAAAAFDRSDAATALGKELALYGTAAGEAGNVRMAFCRGGQILSMTVAEFDGITDPLDGRFQRLVTRLTRDLFPHRDYRGDDGAVGTLADMRHPWGNRRCDTARWNWRS